MRLKGFLKIILYYSKLGPRLVHVTSGDRLHREIIFRSRQRCHRYSSTVQRRRNFNDPDELSAVHLSQKVLFTTSFNHHSYQRNPGDRRRFFSDVSLQPRPFILSTQFLKMLAFILNDF